MCWVVEAKSQQDPGVVKGWEEGEGTQGPDSGRLQQGAGGSAQRNRSQHGQEEPGQGAQGEAGTGQQVSPRGLEMRS